ncbi:MAG: hypothetical protein PHE89_05490 [Alphaproteobacteria bacterium]|nr:hypothetical protein [Alphaproteobacteria bacterium]
MLSKVKNIVTKYYKSAKIKSIDIENHSIYIDIIGQDLEKVDEKMKKDLYNLSVEKVSIIHIKE